jgi:hypothetical protein
VTPVLGEIEPKDPLAFAIDAARQAAISFCQHPLDQSTLLEQLERPGLDADRS